MQVCDAIALLFHCTSQKRKDIHEHGSHNDVQEPAKGRLVNEILTTRRIQTLKIASRPSIMTVFQLGYLSAVWCPASTCSCPARILGLLHCPAQNAPLSVGISTMGIYNIWLCSEPVCVPQDYGGMGQPRTHHILHRRYPGAPRAKDTRPAHVEQSHSYTCVQDWCHAIEETKIAGVGKSREGTQSLLAYFKVCEVGVLV